MADQEASVAAAPFAYSLQQQQQQQPQSPPPPPSPPLISCLKYHENFPATKKLDTVIVKRVQKKVKDTSSCLWVALHEAFVDAHVLDVTGRIDDPSKIKDQCLAYMRIKPDDNKQGAGQMTEEQKKDLYKPEFRDYTFMKEHSFARPATLDSTGVQGSSQLTDQQSNCIGVAEFYQVFCLAKFYFIIFAFSSRVVREVLCRSEQILTLGPLLSKFTWPRRSSIVSSIFSIWMAVKNGNTALSLNLKIQ
jgi:hypothetical protein